MSMRRPFALFCLLASLALSVAGQTNSASRSRSRESPDVAEILANVRNAVGYAAWILSGSGLRLEGTRQHSEVDSRYSLLFSPDGQFLDRTDRPLEEIEGFDGKTGWMVDYSGMPMRLEMDDLETEQVPVWVVTGRWLAEDGPFALTVIPEETDSQRVTLR